MKRKPPKKAGRPHDTKYIESKEKMAEYFEQYRQEVKSKPIIVTDWVGAKAIEVERRKERPLTLEGFSQWLWRKGITGNVHDYFRNKNNAYNDYSGVCRAILEAIRVDQIEGGMAGIYNPSITQRLNGLVEKSAVTVTEQPLFPDVKPDDNK